MADCEAVMALLDQFDAGVLGEEQNGTLRVAFSRTCEMVVDLVSGLHEQNKDLVFADLRTGNLCLNLVPHLDNPLFPPPLPSPTLQENKIGLYTFKKNALVGTSLRHLFDQLLAQHHFPLILEDEPGSDRFYLHFRIDDPIDPINSTSHKSTLKNTLPPHQFRSYFPWAVFVLALAFLAYYLHRDLFFDLTLPPNLEWLLKRLSTAFTNPPIWPFS